MNLKKKTEDPPNYHLPVARGGGWGPTTAAGAAAAVSGGGAPRAILVWTELKLGVLDSGLGRGLVVLLSTLAGEVGILISTLACVSTSFNVHFRFPSLPSLDLKASSQ